MPKFIVTYMDSGQIETQNELLKGLSERLREGNILIGSLQQQLALPEAAHHQRPDVLTVIRRADAGGGGDCARS